MKAKTKRWDTSWSCSVLLAALWIFGQCALGQYTTDSNPVNFDSNPNKFSRAVEESDEISELDRAKNIYGILFNSKQWANYIDANPQFQNLTLKQWEEHQREVIKNYTLRAPTSRAYPFCIDGLAYNANSTEDLATLGTAAHIQTYLTNGFYQPSDGKIRMFDEENGGSPKGFITNITMFELSSPPPYHAEVGGIGKMSRWVHVVIDASEPLMALVVQPIASPLGLPFAQIRTDFDCALSKEDQTEDRLPVTDYEYDDPASQLYRRTLNVPCKYKSRVSSVHPEVYLYNGYIKEEPQKSFRFHMKWDEDWCVRIEVMQFVILAVRDDSDGGVELFRSKAYKYTGGSRDGISYPYSSAWHKKGRASLMTCNKPDKYFVLPTPAENITLVFYHPYYDNCMILRSNLTDDYLCPPHVYVCDVDPLDLEKSNTNPGCNILHCNNPELGARPDIPPDLPLKQINFVAKLRAFRSSHAMPMLVGWGVFAVGFGSTVARYFKETSGISHSTKQKALGVGLWLWIHIGAMYVSAICLWIGIFEIAKFEHTSVPCEELQNDFKRRHNSRGQTFGESCDSHTIFLFIHKGVGWLSIILFHVAFGSGWVRPLNPFNRSIAINLHFYTGYIGKVLAVFSALMIYTSPEVCVVPMMWFLMMELGTILFFGGGQLIQFLADKAHGIKRSLFPIIEAREVGEHKHTFSKYVVLLVHITVVLLLAIMMEASYIQLYWKNVNDVSKNIPKRFGLEGRYQQTKSLLGKCEHRSVYTDARVYDAV